MPTARKSFGSSAVDGVLSTDNVGRSEQRAIVLKTGKLACLRHRSSQYHPLCLLPLMMPVGNKCPMDKNASSHSHRHEAGGDFEAQRAGTLRKSLCDRRGLRREERRIGVRGSRRNLYDVRGKVFRDCVRRSFQEECAKRREGRGEAGVNELATQFHQRPGDPPFRGCLAERQMLADFLIGSLLEEAEEDGVAIDLTQGHEGIVEVGVDEAPGEVFISQTAGVSCLEVRFVPLSASLASTQVAGRVSCCDEQPARERLSQHESRRFACQDQEDDLGGVLGEGWVAEFSEARSVDETKVSLNELVESFLATLAGITLEELSVTDDSGSRFVKLAGWYRHVSCPVGETINVKIGALLLSGVDQAKSNKGPGLF